MKRIILITSLLLLFALPLVVTGASRPAPAAANFQLQFNFGLAYSPLGQDSKHKETIEVLSIVSIDRVNGIVTAKDLRTGETFKFEVDSRSLLKTMRVGQKVWKHGSQKVGILEGTTCCDIVGKGNASSGGRTASSTANASSGATIDGKTLILKKGYEASIDPKNRGVVRVQIPFTNPTSTYTCSCDSDKNAKCAWEAVRKQVHCTSIQGACQQCQILETTKLGGDKAQDQSSPGTSTSPATATGGRTDPDRILVGSRVRWEIKPNPELKGASGQIVFQFPKLTTHGIYEIAVFEIGGTKQITPTWYGSRSFALLEGEYDVEINGMRLSRVPVKGGSDTRLHTGIVRFNTPGGTWVEVFDVNQKKPLCSWNGPSSCVVPPGEFHVKIGGSSKKVTIADGQVIDF